MKFDAILKVAVGAFALTASFVINAGTSCNMPDSVLLFSYSKADGRSGLRLAWSEDGIVWNSIADPAGPADAAYDFVSSDFGPWGSHKTMFAPRLYKTSDGWIATWYVSDKKETIAYARSADLINWEPQKYSKKEDSCRLGCCGLRHGEPAGIELGGKCVYGEIIKVPFSLVRNLTGYVKERGSRHRRESELMKDDGNRFAGMSGLTANISLDERKAPYRISDKLIGIFFEDISYAADGGLYAELIQNRDFEYDYSENHKKGWGSSYSWNLSDAAGNRLKMNFSTDNPLHENNPHYLAVSSSARQQRLENTGFDGISVKKGETYDFSMFVRLGNPEDSRKFIVSIITPDGKSVASAKVAAKGSEWQKSAVMLKAKQSVSEARLVLEIPADTRCDIDMVSLFPSNTFNNRKNGLRRDLAQVLADLKPRFVRFPGGCVAHGDGIDNIYDWKGSIGPLESRKPLRNIWNYHQSRGLGYHEYFLFCEDLNAEPLPVLAAGVPCQNSGRSHSGSDSEITSLGQQCGIPMDRMDDYVQDILDLIEYANGPVDSEWGAKRAEAGHPEPFNLKYIGIGNEDMITEVFEERFKYIHDRLKEKHPEIVVIGTVGPFFEGSDYTEGWKFARKENVAMVDEHYYVAPGWYLNNRGYYDSYDRNGPKVYLGEYASHTPDRKNTLEAALSIALYLTDVERNGDVVEMTSYAPLLAKEGHENWRPDMVFFDNDSIRLTPDYHVQKMYGTNSGTVYFPAKASLSEKSEDVSRRFGYSIVKDEESGDVILKVANLLPVTVDVNADLKSLAVCDGEASVSILSGSPAEECTKPYISSVLIEGGVVGFNAGPYSFSVVRIHTAK